MAKNKTHISVGVVDLPDHERVILKLIFAVSHKSAVRNFAYSLSDLEHANIVLRDASSETPVTAQPVLNVMDSTAKHDGGAPTMLRPLIATRVLAILDDYFAQQQSAPVETEGSHDVAIVNDRADDGTQGDSDATRHIARDISLIDDALLNEDIVVPPPRTADAPKVARKRALVVDDSPAVRKQLEIELVHFDVDVDYAASARQAIAMIDANEYDVAFLDVVLPDMDGYQICKRAKARSRRTKVVMLTGKATTEDKLKGTLAGCDAYLVKPVGRLTFQSTVKNFLPLSVGAQSLKL